LERHPRSPTSVWFVPQRRINHDASNVLESHLFRSEWIDSLRLMMRMRIMEKHTTSIRARRSRTPYPSMPDGHMSVSGVCSIEKDRIRDFCVTHGVLLSFIFGVLSFIFGVRTLFGEATAEWLEENVECEDENFEKHECDNHVSLRLKKGEIRRQRLIHPQRRVCSHLLYLWSHFVPQSIAINSLSLYLSLSHTHIHTLSLIPA